MNSSDPDNILARADAEHLNRLEAIVQRGLDRDAETGAALAEISELRLYRATHDTFEGYLLERWGVDFRNGYVRSRAPQRGAWSEACRAFANDDVAEVELRLTLRKPERPTEDDFEPSPSSSGSVDSESDRPVPQLRWLLTQASGTLADAVHQVETCGADLDEDAREQLRNDLLVVDEELGGWCFSDGSVRPSSET